MFEESAGNSYQHEKGFKYLLLNFLFLFYESYPKSYYYQENIFLTT